MVLSLILYFELSKQRKSTLLVSSSGVVTALFLLSLSYKLEDLRIAKFTLILTSASETTLFSSIFLHGNDLLGPTLVFVVPLAVKVVSFSQGYLVPWIFNVEMLGYQEIGSRLLYASLVGVGSIILMCFVLVETEGKERVDAHELLFEFQN